MLVLVSPSCTFDKYQGGTYELDDANEYESSNVRNNCFLDHGSGSTVQRQMSRIEMEHQSQCLFRCTDSQGDPSLLADDDNPVVVPEEHSWID